MTPEEIIKQLGLQPEPDFNGCEACRIEHKDLQVKQIPRHTCGIDGPNDEDMLKEKRNPTQVAQTDPNSYYKGMVWHIAEIIAKTPYAKTKWNDISHFGEQVKERLISLKIEEAKAVIEEIVKEVTAAYNPQVGDLTIAAYLKKRGLIADTPEKDEPPKDESLCWDCKYEKWVLISVDGYPLCDKCNINRIEAKPAMPEQKMTPQDITGAKDAIRAVINVPPGKCKACYYNQLIHEGVISHVSPIPLHTCDDEKTTYQEKIAPD